MSEPTMAELLRLDEILAQVGGMPETRFRRLWAAYSIRFEWPFSDGENWLWGEDAVAAWEEWADMQGAMRPTL